MIAAGLARHAAGLAAGSRPSLILAAGTDDGRANPHEHRRAARHIRTESWRPAMRAGTNGPAVATVVKVPSASPASRRAFIGILPVRRGTTARAARQHWGRCRRRSRGASTAPLRAAACGSGSGLVAAAGTDDDRADADEHRGARRRFCGGRTANEPGRRERPGRGGGGQGAERQPGEQERSHDRPSVAAGRGRARTGGTIAPQGFGRVPVRRSGVSLVATSAAPRHLERAPVEVRLDFGEVDAFRGEAGEGEVEDVRGLPDDVLAVLGLGQLARLLAQLGGQEGGVGEQLGRVAARAAPAAAPGRSVRSRWPSPVSSPQQVRVSRWQKPAPRWRTTKRGLSRSQSRSMRISSWVAPAGLALYPQAARCATGRRPPAPYRLADRLPGSSRRGRAPCRARRRRPWARARPAGR